MAQRSSGAVLCAALTLCAVAAAVAALRASAAIRSANAHRFFSAVDANADGALCAAELTAYLHRMDSDMRFGGAELKRLIAVFDGDGDGAVGEREWMRRVAEDAPHSAPAVGDSDNGSSVEQVHTALTAEPSELVVMWVTRHTAQPASDARVEFGTSADALSNSVSASADTYTAGGWTGWIYKARLTGLAPATQYYYRCGSPAAGDWSGVANVRSAPRVGADEPIRFASFGDMGTYIPAGFLVTDSLVKQHAATPYNFVLHNGDLAYASTAVPAPPSGSVGNDDDDDDDEQHPEVVDGDDDDDDDDEQSVSRQSVSRQSVLSPSLSTAAAGPVGDEWEWVWDVWVEQIGKIGALSPYMVGVGNHERFFDFQSYLHRFEMPPPWGQTVGSGPQNQTAYWFSFDYGPAHFALMSTEHDYAPGSVQHAWLEADLAAAVARRRDVPWIFVTGHRPMYCIDQDEWDSHRPGASFQLQIEPLLLRYGVDLYMCGHMHMYNRVHPIANGTSPYSTASFAQVYTNPSAPPHVTQGTAGVFTDHKLITPSPSWSAVTGDQFGWGDVQIFNATHLYYQFLHADTREPIDSFWIVKDAPGRDY